MGTDRMTNCTVCNIEILWISARSGATGDMCEGCVSKEITAKIAKEHVEYQTARAGREAIDRALYTTTPLDLTRTVTALRAYDEFMASNPYGIGVTGVCESNEEVYAVDFERDRLGEAVGEAFGHDTADRNSMQTCKGCVRPGVWLRNLVDQFLRGSNDAPSA